MLIVVSSVKIWIVLISRFQLKSKNVINILNLLLIKMLSQDSMLFDNIQPARPNSGMSYLVSM
jgi:hypothetical protein